MANFLARKRYIPLESKSEARENSFIVDTPPPGVSGQLHIGHVYSYTHTDFIVRHRRMKGNECILSNGF
jgi:valyl-tRNA synthetase